MPDFIFKDKKIFYRKEGKGNPLMLVHGFAEDGRVWHRQVKSLSENHLLIIPDLPGSGSSERLEGFVSMSEYAAVLKALSEQVLGTEGDTISMIGHSMGGYITLAFAERYPQLLNAFGLFHSSAQPDDEQKIATRKKGIGFIRKNGTAPFVRTSVPNLFCEETRTLQPELIAEMIDIAQTIAPDTLIQYYEAMIERPDRTAVLRQFDKPVLLIAGKYDSAVPLSASLEQFTMPAAAVVHVLTHSAHMGMWEEAALSNRLLQQFLAEIC